MIGKYTSLFLLSFLMLGACTTAQISQTLGEINKAIGDDQLSTDQVALGLKEALINGISTGSAKASKVDGYFKNPKIKIPFPEDVQRVEDKLRKVGLGKEVDKFVLTLNRGAEEAAKEAKPIFVAAIKEMTIQDAWNILKGEDDAATQYLSRVTSTQLKAKFKPIIQKALDKTNATKYYGNIISTYNKIPFVDKADPELENYATEKAMEGLFTLIAEEEGKIREDPLARTSELLKKVFSQQD